MSKIDAYLMPRVDELLDRLGKAQFCSDTRFEKGNVNVLRENGCLDHTNLLRFLNLFRAPPTFQRLMDSVFHPHQAYTTANLDDIIYINDRTWHM